MATIVAAFSIMCRVIPPSRYLGPMQRLSDIPMSSFSCRKELTSLPFAGHRPALSVFPRLRHGHEPRAFSGSWPARKDILVKSLA